jgi:hypothetical protein
MITTQRECREFKKMLESHRKQKAVRRESQAFDAIGELFRKGEIKPTDWSVRTLFENLVPEGERLLSEMDRNRRGSRRGGVMMEAGEAINTGDFSQIIGQINYGTVQRQLELPALIGNQLCTEVPAETQGQEQIPGVAMLTDQAQEVGEGEDYPKITTSAHTITAPKKVKTGFMIEVTEEVIAEEKTGLLMEQMSRGGEVMGINEERDTLATVLGITTSFIWNEGAPQATYADSHTGFTLDNLIASNALVDYTDIAVVEAAFDAVVDPATGEPVSINGSMQLVYPKALKPYAMHLKNTTEYRQGSIDATTPMKIFGNPLGGEFFNDYDLLTNQYVKETTSSDSTWFAGDFKRAFQRRVIWPTQVFVEDQNSSTARFERDIITRIKVRRKSAMAVVAPWFVIKCTG